MQDEIKRKKILYRARYRGTKELDLLIGAFINSHIEGAEGAMLDDMLTLLECPDGELQACLIGNAEPPAEFADGIRRLQKFAESYRPDYHNT